MIISLVCAILDDVVEKWSFRTTQLWVLGMSFRHGNVQWSKTSGGSGDETTASGQGQNFWQTSVDELLSRCRFLLIA
jgi:hypothetical protein